MNDTDRVKYSELVKFLGKALGENTEVVLQDVDEKVGIVAIANGHVSGRKVGGEPSTFIMEMVENKQYHESHRINFSSIAHNSKVLRSSTYFIRDNQNNLIGMLCINTDISDFLEVSEKIKDLAGLNRFNEAEKAKIREEKELPSLVMPSMTQDEIYLISVKDAVEDHLQSIQQEMEIDIPLSRLNAQEKQQIVLKLQDKGVFNLKGAVTEVADCMGVSEPTIYRYLSKSNTN